MNYQNVTQRQKGSMCCWENGACGLLHAGGLQTLNLWEEKSICETQSSNAHTQREKMKETVIIVVYEENISQSNRITLYNLIYWFRVGGKKALRTGT